MTDGSEQRRPLQATPKTVVLPDIVPRRLPRPRSRDGRQPPSLLEQWRDLEDTADAAAEARALQAAKEASRGPQLVLRDPAGLHAGLKAVCVKGQATKDWVVALAQRYEARIAALEEELGLAATGELHCAALHGALGDERSLTKKYEQALRALQERVWAATAGGQSDKAGSAQPQVDLLEQRKLEQRMQKEMADARAEQDRIQGLLDESRAEVRKLQEYQYECALKADAKLSETERELDFTASALAEREQELQNARSDIIELKAEIDRENQRRRCAEGAARRDAASAKQRQEEEERRLRMEAADAAASSNKAKEAFQTKLQELEKALESAETRISEESDRRQAAEARAAASDQLRLSVVKFCERVDTTLARSSQAPVMNRGPMRRRSSLGSPRRQASMRRRASSFRERVVEPASKEPSLTLDAPASPGSPVAAQADALSSGQPASPGGPRAKARSKKKSPRLQPTALDPPPQPVLLSPQETVRAAMTGDDDVKRMLDGVHSGVEVLVATLQSLGLAVDELTKENLELHEQQQGLRRDYDEFKTRADRERTLLEEQNRQAEKRALELHRKLQAHGQGKHSAKVQQVTERDEELRKEMEQIETKLHVNPQMSTAFKSFLKRMHNSRIVAAVRSEKNREKLMSERTKLLESALEAVDPDYQKAPQVDGKDPQNPKQAPGTTVRMNVGADGVGGGLALGGGAPPAGPLAVGGAPQQQQQKRGSGPEKAIGPASPLARFRAQVTSAAPVAVSGKRGQQSGPSVPPPKPQETITPDLVSQLIGSPLGKGPVSVGASGRVRVN
eukprot:TRINITY_DN43781_c0_g1_i1.p1 TRINITY_DN43781_c0_g1~~TRINITY_DN43781_c0_g1_i1.p1  ORF type:complete len:796 (+),score=262.89 TRINITY_DN43781_c0_g1_i1:65-2452(+)